MTKFFTIYSGLRGAYSDSSGLHGFSAETLKELRDHLESEARDIRDAEAVGLNKRAVAALARDAWEEADKARPAVLPYVAPYRWHGQTPGNFPYGLFCAVATESEYLESIGQVRINAPSHWASALINGDESGMEEGEIAELAAWLKAEDLTEAEAVDCGDESSFGRFYFHVQNRELGCDLVEYTFQRHDSEC